MYSTATVTPDYTVYYHPIRAQNLQPFGVCFPPHFEWWEERNWLAHIYLRIDWQLTLLVISSPECQQRGWVSWLPYPGSDADLGPSGCSHPPGYRPRVQRFFIFWLTLLWSAPALLNPNSPECTLSCVTLRKQSIQSRSITHFRLSCSLCGEAMVGSGWARKKVESVAIVHHAYSSSAVIALAIHHALLPATGVPWVDKEFPMVQFIF